MYSYLFDPVAANEYEDAFEWYQQRSKVAADNLFVEVEETIRLVCKNPFRYKNAYKNLHEIPLKKYPYYLIYLVDEPHKIITIISLFHNKRNPEKKYRNL